MFRSFVSVLAAALAVAAAARVEAQVLGTFTWQTQPYCNRLALTLTSGPNGFSVIGLDDGCGAPRKAAVTGTIVINADGTAGLRLAVAPADGGPAVDLSALISTATGSGSWADAFGNGGLLSFGAALPGLPHRPQAAVPVDVLDNPQGNVDPCFMSPPQTLTFCGVAGVQWAHGGLGMPGLQVWRDDRGQVHVRGSARRTVAPAVGPIFLLPPAMQPKRTMALTVGASRPTQNLGGPALVIVYGKDAPGHEGQVVVQYSTTAADQVVHFGEVVFSVDR